MKKEILSRVTIDMELLSDMETLNVVGGFSYDPNTTNAEKCVTNLSKCVTNGDECTFNETKCIVNGTLCIANTQNCKEVPKNYTGCK